MHLPTTTQQLQNRVEAQWREVGSCHPTKMESNKPLYKRSQAIFRKRSEETQAETRWCKYASESRYTRRETRQDGMACGRIGGQGKPKRGLNHVRRLPKRTNKPRRTTYQRASLIRKRWIAEHDPRSAKDKITQSNMRGARQGA